MTPGDEHRTAVLEALARIEQLLERSGAAPTLLSMRGAAASMGLSPSTFDRYVRPAVPFVQVGTRRLYRPADLSRWADARVNDAVRRADRPR